MVMRVLDAEATGRKIKELRKAKKVTVEMIGERLNLSDQAIYKWQRGDSAPTIDNLLLLSDMLDTSLDELVQTKEIDSGLSA